MLSFPTPITEILGAISFIIPSLLDVSEPWCATFKTVVFKSSLEYISIGLNKTMFLDGGLLVYETQKPEF